MSLFNLLLSLLILSLQPEIVNNYCQFTDGNGPSGIEEEITGNVPPPNICNN